jgi:DNA repair photolyase
MQAKEIQAKGVLTRSRIPGVEYCVNPYVGCAHGCRYCYAAFMKRFTGHAEPWGEFLDAKVNAPALLRSQLRRARPGRVLLSSVTDPYQPAEKVHRLTRRCLESLLDFRFPVSILTRSPLVLRDLDLLTRFRDVTVGLSIPTDDDAVRALLEPRSPPIPARIEALEALHAAGVPTYVFDGPLLPQDPDRYVEAVGDASGEVLVDRLNYSDQVRSLYRRHGLIEYLEDGWFEATAAALRRGFRARGVSVKVLF